MKRSLGTREPDVLQSEGDPRGELDRRAETDVDLLATRRPSRS